MGYPIAIKAGTNIITWPIYWVGSHSATLCARYAGKISSLSRVADVGEISPATGLPYNKTVLLDPCASDLDVFWCRVGDVITIEATQDFIMNLSSPITFPSSAYLIWPGYWPTLYASEWATILGGKTVCTKIAHWVFNPTYNSWGWQSFIVGFSTPYSTADFILDPGEYVIVMLLQPVTYGTEMVVPTVVTLKASSTTATVNAPVTFSGTLTSGGAGLSFMDVQVLVGGQLLQTVTTDSNGYYSFTLSFVAPGTYLVTAHFPGVSL